MKAKRKVTTSPVVRRGSIQRGPTPRRKQGTAVPFAALAPVKTPKRSTATRVEAIAEAPAAPPIVEVDLSVDLGRGLVLPNPILVA